MADPAPEAYFVLNGNPGEDDVLHRNPREECNLDDSKGRQTVDPETADALLALGTKRCQHCYAKETP